MLFSTVFTDFLRLFLYFFMFHVKRSNLATHPMFHVKHKKRQLSAVVFVFTKIKYFCPFLKVFGVQGCFFKSTPHIPLQGFL